MKDDALIEKVIKQAKNCYLSMRYKEKFAQDIIDLVRSSGWISVDTPPENDGSSYANVACFCRDGVIPDCVYSFQKEEFYHNSDTCLQMPLNNTHWMKLLPPTNKGEIK